MKPYKSINFDLDTKELKEKYPGNSYENAYYDVREFFESNGFKHSQGSGYMSIRRLNQIDVIDIINQLVEEMPWIKGCFKKLYVSDMCCPYEADMKHLTDLDEEQEQKIDDPKKATDKKINDKNIDDTYVTPEKPKQKIVKHR